MKQQYYRFLTDEEKAVNWVPGDENLPPDELKKKASRIEAAKALGLPTVLTDSVED